MPDHTTRLKRLLGLPVSPTRAAREALTDRLAARLSIPPTPYDATLLEQRRRLITDSIGAAVRLVGGHLVPFPTAADATGSRVDLDSRYGGHPHTLRFGLYGRRSDELGAVTVSDVLGATPLVGVEIGRTLLAPVPLLDANGCFELAVRVAEKIRTARRR